MARVKAFQAIRYDECRAGTLDSLVAPPYDVLGPGDRARFLAASPYNVVHLTLPDDVDRAASLWREWRTEGVLARDGEPATWWLEQEYVGPDGVRRTREGLVCALHSEPYSAGIVLPHERTHAGPKEGRLRLLTALRAHVEPLFFLYDGSLERPQAEPILEVELDGVRNRLGKLQGPAPDLADATLLIADGHHRYETTLAFHEQDGSQASAWLLAVIVPTAQEGLTIFPTHRLAEDVEIDGAEPSDRPPLELLAAGAGPVLYRGGRSYVLATGPDELDVEAIEPLLRGEVTYTPMADEAVARVDRGEAGAALLLRPPAIDQVRAVAERGETMPQKSTYFFPKLPSGLLFLAL
jgi:uncharacterized protein (DUF1015 family)